MLTQKRVKELFDYDPETGVLIWIKKPHNLANRVKIGSVAGYGTSNKYRELELNGIVHGVHRIAWLFVYGFMPDQIDHINGDPSDNRICNLRDVNSHENAKNRKRRKDNKSGVMGVAWYRWNEKWVVTISIDKKRKCLGYFEDKNDAINARKLAEKRYGYHENHGRN